MDDTSRHGIPSLKFLPKDGRVSYFGRSSGRSAIQFLTVHIHPVSDRTHPSIRVNISLNTTSS